MQRGKQYPANPNVAGDHAINDCQLTEVNTLEQNHRNEDQEEDESTKKPAICHFFKKGNCKHGMRGKECKYTHPKVCTKFVHHGTRQPRGCNLGSSCKDYHPKMCMSSLRKGECFSENCRFNHIKGTKRFPPTVKNKVPVRGNKPNESESTKPCSNDFLEMIRLMKAEILQTIDHKITSMTTQTNTFQNQQTQRRMTNQIPNQIPMIPNFIPQQSNMSMLRHQLPEMMIPNQPPTQQMLTNHSNQTMVPNQQPTQQMWTNNPNQSVVPNQQSNHQMVTNPTQQ